MKDAAELITAIAALTGAIVWPVIIAFIGWRFRTPLASFVSDMGSFTLKAAGFEASASRRQVEFAAAMGAAEATSSRRQSETGSADRGVARDLPNADDGPAPVDPRSVARSVLAAVPDRRAERAIEGSRVLWVDDRPSNNGYETQALRALGVAVEQSLDTDDALAKLARTSFDLVISDMGRPPDPRAGYTLLDAMRARGDGTPFVIYASSRSRRHVEEALRHGALGCTNSAQDLLQLVVTGLRSTPRVDRPSA